MKSTVLLVEDEEGISSFVETALQREGFSTQIAHTGEEAVDVVKLAPPDLVLLDIMLPGIDGLEVCRQIRSMPSYLPIIMLTAKGEEIDRVVGLELGADDYIAKPFSARELIARIRAVLRLAAARQETREEHRQIVVNDQIQIDLDGRVVTVRGLEVELTPKEFDLLALIAGRRGRVFGRDTLLENVWGFDYLGDSRTVDVHIQRLRGKIERDPHNPEFILTVRTVGYKFAE